MTTILQLANIKKSFGAVVVANNLNFTLENGAALGVIGPNGAGKTSMFNLITGTLKPDSGDVLYKGSAITALSVANRCRLGIARSFQIPQPFGHMSVFENVLVAATQGAQNSIADANRRCLDILDQTGLISQANSQAGKLTLLERKRLELSRALAANPTLLLLDEIAGGLTELECSSLVDTINEIRSTGITIVWIEHVVHALLAVVDQLMVIDFGKMIALGEPNEIMASTVVQETYLGIEADA